MVYARHLLAATSMLVLAAAASEVHAQAAARPAQVEEVVVTGSHIEGLAKSAALPVDVISAAELRIQGQPSPVELVKSLPYITGAVLGDNSFTNSSARTSGAANINLRGLSGAGTNGFERTLVLFNGERVANFNTTNMQTTDLNTLPMFAVGRIETLKNGGSSAYGSDAIAGVVNFITSKTLNGFDVGADYQRVADTSGFWNAHINWGKTWDGGNVLLSVGANHTSALSTFDRSWAIRPLLDNPQGFLSSSNPGTYIVATSTGNAGPNKAFVDPGCTALGGVQSPVAGPSGAPICYSSKIPFQNIVDESDRYQIYAELNYSLTDNIKAHVDAWYSQTKIPHLATFSTSGQANAFPTLADIGGAGVGKLPGTSVGLATGYYVPANNPGLQDLLGKYNAAQLGLTPAQFAFAQTNGVNTGAGWDIFGLGGQPAFDGGRATALNRYRSGRISGGLDGEFNEIHWTTRVTAGQFDYLAGFPDNVVQRTQLALRGLGGAGCTGTTPGANGCVYFNPFSTAYASNPTTGVANTGFINNANTNSRALAQWMTDPDNNNLRTREVTGEAGLNGLLNFLELPGGKVGWAVGVQYRWNQIRNSPQNFVDLSRFPCTDLGQPASACAPLKPGPMAFFGGNLPLRAAEKTTAEYIEFSLPVTDKIQVQLAGRHEDTEGRTTTDPKISVRWQLFDMVALRASGERTFKAPTPIQIDTSAPGTNSVAVGATRIPSIQSGNPALRPESSISFDAGIIINPRGLLATIDYWSYELTDPIALENSGNFVATMFPANSQTGHCGEAAFSALQAKLGFVNDVCGLTNLNLIRTLYVNGPKIKTRGVDFDVSYKVPVAEGLLTVATNTTRILEFSQEDLFLSGTPILVLGKYDQVGKYNIGVVAGGRPLPKWRSENYVNFALGPHNLRWTLHYSGGYTDNRVGVTGVDPTAQVAGFPTGTSVTTGLTIKAAIVNDLSYSYATASDWRFQLVVTNIFDKDPPFARTDMSYSQETGSPLGRVFRFGVNKTF